MKLPKILLTTILSSTLFIACLDPKPLFTKGVDPFTELIGNWTINSVTITPKGKAATIYSRADICNDDIPLIHFNAAAGFVNFNVAYNSTDKVNEYSAPRCDSSKETITGVLEQSTTHKYKSLFAPDYSSGYNLTVVSITDQTLVIDYNFVDNVVVTYSKN